MRAKRYLLICFSLLLLLTSLSCSASPEGVAATVPPDEFFDSSARYFDWGDTFTHERDARYCAWFGVGTSVDLTDPSANVGNLYGDYSSVDCAQFLSVVSAILAPYQRIEIGESSDGLTGNYEMIALWDKKETTDDSSDNTLEWFVAGSYDRNAVYLYEDGRLFELIDNGTLYQKLGELAFDISGKLAYDNYFFEWVTPGTDRFPRYAISEDCSYTTGFSTCVSHVFSVPNPYPYYINYYKYVYLYELDNYDPTGVENVEDMLSTLARAKGMNYFYALLHQDEITGGCKVEMSGVKEIGDEENIHLTAWLNADYEIIQYVNYSFEVPYIVWNPVGSGANPPSPALAEEIEKGMKISKVNEILGRYRRENRHITRYLEYDLSDGSVLVVYPTTVKTWYGAEIEVVKSTEIKYPET